MRWFFALNENSASFWDYANLLQVAVHTARRNTKLQPVCLYDGAENALTGWLKSVGVPVCYRRSFLHNWVVSLSSIARGAFLRFEIPEVCREMGWDDEFVLYTDCDVMFARDPAPLLAPLRPRFFCAAPEIDPENWAHFNSGVIWMNVRGFGAELPAVKETIRANLHDIVTRLFDQGTLQLHFGARAERLPRELNWKPYWGSNDAAVIWHFHGPKPAQKYAMLNRRAPDMIQRLGGDGYLAACRRWDDELCAALAAHPWPEGASEGVASGFEGFDAARGLGDPEGPFPENHMPVVRWGLAPRAEIDFTLAAHERARLELVFQYPHPDQAFTVTVDGTQLAHGAVLRIHEPQTVVLDLPPLPAGGHRLVVEWAKTFRPGGGDPRELGLLFRTLRVRRERGT